MKDNKIGYGSNETMTLLGYQYINNFFNDDVFQQLDEILKARSCDDIKWLAMDVYMLGVINGQRKERAKHKSK